MKVIDKSNYKSLENATIQPDDKVVFPVLSPLNGSVVNVEYIVNSGGYLQHRTGHPFSGHFDNATVFKGIIPDPNDEYHSSSNGKFTEAVLKFCEEGYGFKPTRGIWPYAYPEGSRTDWKALNKLVIKIFDILHTNGIREYLISYMAKDGQQKRTRVSSTSSNEAILKIDDLSELIFVISE